MISSDFADESWPVRDFEKHLTDPPIGWYLSAAGMRNSKKQGPTNNDRNKAS